MDFETFIAELPGDVKVSILAFDLVGEECRLYLTDGKNFITLTAEAITQNRSEVIESIRARTCTSLPVNDYASLTF